MTEYTRGPGAPTGTDPTPERVWSIRDASGRPYGKRHRIGDGEDKKVWWSDHTASGLSPKEFPFYGSEQAETWDPDEPVIIGEGEKVRDALHEAGYAALGTLGTSHLPADRFFEPLRSRTVVLTPDNDPAGREHMGKVREKAHKVGARVLWYEWEGAPPKGDLADHPVVQYGSVEERDRLLNDLLCAPRCEPKKPEVLQGRVLLGELLKGGIEPTPQLLDGLLYEGRIHSVASGPGTGKTLLAEWMAIQIMRRGHRVLYLDAENGPKLIAERLQELGADLDTVDEGFFYYPADLSLDAESMARLAATVEEVRPALVVFDSFADFLALAGLEENSNSDCTLWMTRVAQPLKDVGVAVLLLDHVPKSGNGGPRGAGSKVAKVDVAWSLEVTLSFDRERTGQITLKHTKDREAWLPRMVQFSVGGGVLARSSGTVEQREGDGLTNSQRTALEALKPHPEGLTYSDWKGACGVPDQMGNGTFDNARRALLDAGLVRKERQRWYASGPGTPPGTPRLESTEESGTPAQVHQDSPESENALQNRGTPGPVVPKVYPGVVANNEGTPTYTPLIRGVGVPMAGVPEHVPLSLSEIGQELARPNRGPAKALASWLEDPNPTRLEYLVRSVLHARGLPTDGWERHAEVVEFAATDPDNHPPRVRVRGMPLMPPVHDDALRRLEDARAIQDELLDPFEDADRIGAELRDALLSFDRDAYFRAEEEAERAGRAQRRLRALWTQAQEAVESGNGGRVSETALAIRYVSERSFAGIDEPIDPDKEDR